MRGARNGADCRGRRSVTSTFQFESNGEPKNAAVTIYIVKNGKWEVAAVK